MRTVLLVASLLAVAPLTAAPVPKSIKGPGVIYIWTNSQPPVLNLYTPDGEHIKEVKLDTKKECKIIDVSPGGKFVVVTSEDGKLNPAGGIEDTLVHLVPLGDAEGELPEPIIRGRCPTLRWSTDGRTAYITLEAGVERFGHRGRRYLTSVIEYDTVSERKRALDLGDGHEVLDVSADGRELLTTTRVFDPGEDKHEFAHIVQVGTGECQPLYEAGEIHVHSFHPDGKRVFAIRVETPKVGGGKINPRLEYIILDLETGESAPLEWEATLKMATRKGETSRWSVSPDRKRVVVKWTEQMRVPVEGRDWEWRWVDRLGVCDLNGRNFKAFVTVPQRVIGWPQETGISGFAWR